eukprot:442582-Pyramimonas_sp.AAC.1
MVRSCYCHLASVGCVPVIATWRRCGALLLLPPGVGGVRSCYCHLASVWCAPVIATWHRCGAL